MEVTGPDTDEYTGLSNHCSVTAINDAKSTRKGRAAFSGGNDVESGAGAQVTGNYWYLWQVDANWDEYLDSAL